MIRKVEVIPISVASFYCLRKICRVVFFSSFSSEIQRNQRKDKALTVNRVSIRSRILIGNSGPFFPLRIIRDDRLW